MNKFTSFFSGIIADHQTQRFTERTERIFSDAECLSTLSRKWQNVANDKAQGHIFEQLEIVKFNYDALKKDSELYARTTASMGLGTDPVDIVIKKGNDTIREVQAKSCNSAARSTFALSNEKYLEMQRLAPSDQHEAIEKLLKQRIEAGTLKAEDYEQTLRNLKKSLSHDEVASSGTTYQEAIDATNQEIADKIANQYKLKAALSDMHQSGMQAGKIGAGIASSMTAISEGVAFFKNERKLADVAVNTAIAGAKGYATGYTVTALSKGLAHTTSHLLGEGIAKSLTRSNAHIAIAAGVVNSGKSMIAYMKGDIDFEELSNQISHTAITGSSAFYYGAAGQMLIPIPVLGALIGSSVGYVIGNLIYQSGLLALGDSAVVKASRARRKQIEEFCMQAIPQIQAHRQELEAQFKQNNDLRQLGIDFGFSLIQESLDYPEPERFVQGLRKIGEQFNIVLPYKNFDEFDTLMKAKEDFVF